MARRAAALVFWLGALVFGLMFLLIFATKLTAGQWQGYFGMALFGLGCAACVVSARRPRVSERQDA